MFRAEVHKQQQASVAAKAAAEAVSAPIPVDIAWTNISDTEGESATQTTGELISNKTSLRKKSIDGSDPEEVDARRPKSGAAPSLDTKFTNLATTHTPPTTPPTAAPLVLAAAGASASDAVPKSSMGGSATEGEAAGGEKGKRKGSGSLRIIILASIMALLGTKALEVSRQQKHGRYQVMKGDSLYSISKKTHQSIQDLAKKNGIKNVNLIPTNTAFKW